jgi:hypothetical protein
MASEIVFFGCAYGALSFYPGRIELPPEGFARPFSPHLALILDELNRLKVPLIASSQGIDTSNDNPAGRLQLGVLMAVAEFERGIIRERVNSGIAAATG